MKLVSLLLGFLILTSCVNQVMTAADGPVSDTLDANPSTTVSPTVDLKPV